MSCRREAALEPISSSIGHTTLSGTHFKVSTFWNPYQGRGPPLPHPLPPGMATGVDPQDCGGTVIVEDRGQRQRHGGGEGTLKRGRPLHEVLAPSQAQPSSSFGPEEENIL